jgi:hypothetical protein
MPLDRLALWASFCAGLDLAEASSSMIARVHTPWTSVSQFGAHPSRAMVAETYRLRITIVYELARLRVHLVDTVGI